MDRINRKPSSPQHPLGDAAKIAKEPQKNTDGKNKLVVAQAFQPVPHFETISIRKNI